MRPDRRPTPRQDDRNTGNTGPNRQGGRDDEDVEREFQRGDDEGKEREGGRGGGQGREDDRGRTGGPGGGGAGGGTGGGGGGRQR